MNSQETRYAGITALEQGASARDFERSVISNLKTSLNDITKNGLFIFGVGKLGQKICRFLVKNGFNVLGFVDNNKNVHGNDLMGLKVAGVDSLDNSRIVFVASETFQYPILKQLRELKIEKLISPYQGSVLFSEFNDYPADMFYKDTISDLYNNKGRYLEVFGRLEDEESRRTFDQLLSYRITGNIDHIASIATDPGLEYFDPAVYDAGEDEVFYDCGGYDGDSSLAFTRFCNGSYKSIHVFEPDSELLQKSRVRLKDKKNIFFNEVGIFDVSTSLFFEDTGGSDGVISMNGSRSITTTTVDEYSVGHDKPTYIKVDIEGVEIEALKGGKETIKKFKPRMALASYHYPRHLWQIPEEVFRMTDEYSLRLRHYSYCIFGSIYYFLPKTVK